MHFSLELLFFLSLTTSTSSENISDEMMQLIDIIIQILYYYNFTTTQVISYKADRKKKVERTEIARAVVGMMFKKDGSTERIEFLTIPETPITGSCRNRLIDLSYELEVRDTCFARISYDLFINFRLLHPN